MGDVRDNASERGFIVHDTVYRGTKAKYKYTCPFNHTWEARFESIKAGQGCPICSGSNGERICRSILEEIFEITFPKRRPHFLYEATGKRLELDGYNENNAIAFEYHGIQHYNPYGIFKNINLKDQQKLDKLKEIICKKEQIKLIVIPYFKKLDDEHHIFDHLEKCITLADIEIPEKFYESKKNFKFQMYCPDLEEMKNIALNHGGELISKFYIDAHTKLTFECKNKHIHKMIPNSVRAGQWCWQCGGSYPLSIEIVKEIAAQRGEKCLSASYKNQSEKLLFRCAENHEYFCTTKNYKKGRGCPICAKENRPKTRRIGIEKMHEYADARRGKCLSTEYINNHTHIMWQCEHGHQWNAQPSSIKQGTWCPKCSMNNRRQKLQ